MNNTFVFVIFATSFVICMITMVVAALLGRFHDNSTRRIIDKGVVHTVFDSSMHDAAGPPLQSR